MRSFGTTRVLSSPRLTVLNNQTAVLKVATNQVYFVTQAQFTTVTNANGSAVTTDADLHQHAAYGAGRPGDDGAARHRCRSWPRDDDLAPDHFARGRAR